MKGTSADRMRGIVVDQPAVSSDQNDEVAALVRLILERR